MSINLNFRNIRTHDGSQNSGFEELVCQLARLQKPSNADRFVKKEGAGGDAGIECYWILNDESEIGWQAKYFPDGMNPSRWQQLDESFETALNKHPNLTKYVVCMPLDKSDSRKTGRGGATVTSVEDEWNERVKRWNKQAQEKDRNVEFEYWGKHEIFSFLTIDDPLYSGRALYWFNEPLLGLNSLEQIAVKARDCLGDRYTPEFHIDLPVAKNFDGLCLNEPWWKILNEELSKLADQGRQFFKTFLVDEPDLLEQKEVNDLHETHENTLSFLSGVLLQKSAICDFQPLRELVQNGLDKHTKLSRGAYQENILGNDKLNDEAAIFRNFYSIWRSLSDFLDSKRVNATEIKAALLYGEAGIGKSHLLCDISLHRIENNLPTLFLLGSQYGGGNPTELVKDAVDLKGYRNKQVLGALDAIGEAYRTRTLIVIDAINEGPNRDDWYNHLRSFLSDASEFNHIAVLLSCRNTYLDYILPESVNEECLVRVKHRGFLGYEHRAAEKYLSQQGISKPSAPILAPEFTNPLFLKTCCRALKANKQTSFPKGLQGITSLFDFYLDSVEQTVARNKRYRPSEQIIKETLIEFASKLFPDHLYGIPITEARSLINKHDPSPNREDSLFDELLYEGILSEDISYENCARGKPVIRFTYERFSDHFIAQQVLEQHGSEDINNILSEDQPLGKVLIEKGYYRLAGIFEALAIALAEKYGKEVVDLLPDEAGIADWQLDQMFSNTVIWRDPCSFTERTLEILNSLRGLGSERPSLDILLKLSTEPQHPWNAVMLHRNLVGKEVSKRDAFWSISIAWGHSAEEDEEEESIVRTLIEWSCFGDISNVEEERIRLTAVTLLWFLTTSNRTIRDRATKSLVRILSVYPALLPDLVRDFHAVNDLYLVERLYAVIYGVVCNISDRQLISEISHTVYELVFKDGKPVPHILLRDYARGVLEFAYHLELLEDEVSIEAFRPPYSSEWPIENPTNSELEELFGDNYSSDIKSSLMGFPGDFGNYTMSCVHNWSLTPLSVPSPQTGYELNKEFALNCLSGETQKEYLENIEPDPTKTLKMREFLEKISKGISLGEDEGYEKAYEREREERDKFKSKVEAQLDDSQKEYYRWVSGLSLDRPAAFSRKWAQRWVCKRAYEFGWSEELFSDFERSCPRGRGSGLGGNGIERIGKKYQWVALYEFLARLSDNVYWIDRGYSDIEDEGYYGPWQIYKRNIDPSIWLRKNGEYRSWHNEQNTWWQQYSFPFHSIQELTEQRNFLMDEATVPQFSKLLQVMRPEDGNCWTVLRGFWSERQRNIENRENAPELDGWFRINSIFVHKDDVGKVEKEIVGKARLGDPHIIHVQTTQHEGFLGEYPWHPIYQYMTGWNESAASYRKTVPVNYFVPVSEYEWETGNTDYSLDASLSFYLPAKELVEGLGLARDKEGFGAWVNQDSEVVFFDPSVDEYGPSYGLIDTRKLTDWLDENDMEIVWLIGGEKQLFSHNAMDNTFYGRLDYSGLFRLVDGKPVGSLWFEEQAARVG